MSGSTADVPVRREIVDSHVHFWNLLHPTLRWSWLAPTAVHPILGDIGAIKSTVYEPESLWAEARFAGVTSFVHVQAADSPDPVEETRWLTELAARSGGIPAAVVAHADLRDPDVDTVLDGHAASPIYRGIRDFGCEAYLMDGEIDARYEESLRRLERENLVFDLDCTWQNMGAAAMLAERHPNVQVVLEHVGYPRRRDREYFDAWVGGITALADADNVICKISGIAMTDRLFTRESLAPWVSTCLDAFGAERCVVGSNWPVDRLCSSYDVIMDVYRSFVSELSDDEQTAILSANARRIYRL